MTVPMQKRVIDRLLSELDKLKVENSLLKNGGRTGQQLLNLISESSPIKLRYEPFTCTVNIDNVVSADGISTVQK